ARRESSSVSPLAEVPTCVERYVEIAQALVPLELAWRVGAVLESVGRRPFVHSVGVAIVHPTPLHVVHTFPSVEVMSRYAIAPVIPRIRRNAS
ncbi:hypothetical protein LPJ59_000937, partial [Coemansia sp. RSA 2399]